MLYAVTTIFPFEGAGGHEAVWELPMPSWAYGAIALGVFLALLGVVWMFRNTAHGALDDAARARLTHGHDGAGHGSAPAGGPGGGHGH